MGNAKARAVTYHAAGHGLDLMASFAYGDHHSDLPFMALAGESLLVGAVAEDISATVAKRLRDVFLVFQPQSMLAPRINRMRRILGK